MATEPKYPYREQGDRLRLLRLAEKRGPGTAFAKFLGWNQSGYSQFETGSRMIPGEKVRQLTKMIPGFDPLWLWEGRREGLGFDLRRRIEAEEEKMAAQSARNERQDV